MSSLDVRSKEECSGAFAEAALAVGSLPARGEIATHRRRRSHGVKRLRHTHLAYTFCISIQDLQIRMILWISFNKQDVCYVTFNFN